MSVTTVRNKLFGAPLDPMNKDTRHGIALVAFIAWVGLGADGISSSCYGPEEAFRALGEHTHLGLYLALATAGTVFIIALAYNQVIELFPTGGGGYGATINVAINAPSKVAVPYEVGLQVPALTSVGSAWNWKPASPAGGWLKGQVTEQWQSLGGQTATLGLTATGSSAALKPTAVTVGGKACTLV